MDKIEYLMEKVAQLEAELAAQRAAVKRADDYRQVVNCMMRHIYGYYYHTEEAELAQYWSRREDIQYAHGDTAHYGREGVYNYYVKGTAQTKLEARKLAEKYYGVTYTGSEAAGYRVVHVLGSPYVEIAGDGLSAQGVWMAFSTMARIDTDGLSRPFSQVQRFSGEFLFEDGQWKIWHVRDYEDFTFDSYKIARELDGSARPTDPKRNYASPDPAVRAEQGVRELEFFSSYGYQPWTVTAIEPRLPEPYEHWSDAQSFHQLKEKD